MVKENEDDLEEKMISRKDKMQEMIGIDSDCRDSSHLAKIRRFPRLRRIFRSMNSGSLRKVVLMWLRMSMGFGMLTLPFYSKQFGGITVCLLLIIASLINYQSYTFIFDAAYHLNNYNYSNLIENLLGSSFLNVFRITYLIDIFSTIIINSIICWNMFEYMIYFFNIGEKYWKDWILDLNNLTFNELNPTIIKIRGFFFYGTLLVILPLILKKNLAGLQKVTVGYLVALITLVLIIVIEVPFYKAAYKNEDIGFHLLKKPDFNWLECFLGICGCFYVQPFVFSLRKELFIANKRRIVKVSSIGVKIAGIIFIILAFFGYFALGDIYTPVLFILRKPYPNKNYLSEMIFRCSITIFFVFNTLGLAMYSSIVRDYIYQLFNISKGKIKYILISILPYFSMFTIGFVYPHVISFTNLFGLTIYNFNGYIIPFLLKIKMNQINNASLIVKTFTWIGFAIFASFGIIGLVFRFEGLVNL